MTFPSWRLHHPILYKARRWVMSYLIALPLAVAIALGGMWAYYRWRPINPLFTKHAAMATKSFFVWGKDKITLTHSYCVSRDGLATIFLEIQTFGGRRVVVPSNSGPERGFQIFRKGCHDDVPVEIVLPPNVRLEPGVYVLKGYAVIRGGNELERETIEQLPDVVFAIVDRS